MLCVNCELLTEERSLKMTTRRGLESSSDILKHFVSPTLFPPISDSQLGDGVNGKWPITPGPRV